MTQPISELPVFLNGLFTDVRDVLFETATRVKERMSQSGTPSTSPVQWDSPKQQAAYFASNGFGKGIPYHRTGDYERGWSVERQALGVALVNSHPAAGAIGGMPSGWQSRIHRGRWPYLLQVLSDELNKLPDEIRNKFTARAK